MTAEVRRNGARVPIVRFTKGASLGLPLTSVHTAERGYVFSRFLLPWKFTKLPKYRLWRTVPPF